MVSHVRAVTLIAALVALAATAGSCRSTRAPAIVEPALASCVPADTIVLMGLNLDELRATSLYRSLPPNALAAAGPLRDASYLLVAYNTREFLFAARGKFHEAPPGATLISSELAIAGPADAIRMAIAQHQTGVTGSPRLLELAAGIAGGRQLWIAAQGGVTLPLTGNLANLNRILRLTDSVTLAARIDSRIQVDGTGAGRTADAARQLEENLRAILTFAAAGSGRNSEIGAMLNSVEIRRDGQSVHAELSSSPESAEKLVRELTR
jgi:hypothetical protein